MASISPPLLLFTVETAPKKRTRSSVKRRAIQSTTTIKPPIEVGTPKPVQLDFFVTEDVGLLRLEMEDLKKKQMNLQRGLFQRLSDMSKIVMKQQSEIEQLKAHINSYSLGF